MGRRILFITTDQQRHDALGCTGGTVAQTPFLDGLAKKGLNYRRAHNQNVVCMPSRTTMLTGLYPRSHGVVTNGRVYPSGDPTVAGYLHEKAGYRTALLGKAHFDPVLTTEFFENWAASRDKTGPNRGFERMECLFHSGRSGKNLTHYPKWLQENFPEEVDGYYPLFNKGSGTLATFRGGDTGAVQVKFNPIQRDHYHTDWVADRTIAFLDTLNVEEDWFVWMSFPDPHHPWDPPKSELHRCNWRDIDLPSGYPKTRKAARKILAEKPRHWLEWYEGRGQFNYELPRSFVAAEMTADQVREINAMTHIENELIDEAVRRVMTYVDGRGWGPDTDVLYTTDHGEFQGDFGLLFKGPAHVESLMRVPMVWRPAPSARVRPLESEAPVGHVDLAPTFCAIAGVPVPEWMQGEPLPTRKSAKTRDHVLTEWQDDYGGNEIRMNTIYQDGYICSAYDKTNYYDGTEGELYDVREDPNQWHNLWNDKKYASLKSDLVASLNDNLPPERDGPLERIVPV